MSESTAGSTERGPRLAMTGGGSETGSGAGSGAAGSRRGLRSDATSGRGWTTGGAVRRIRRLTGEAGLGGASAGVTSGSNKPGSIKGFAEVRAKPMRLVVQGVGRRVAAHYDRSWKGTEPRDGRLVVIGLKGFDQDAVAAALRG